MADTKISALTGAGAAALANEHAINEAGASKKVTQQQMLDAVSLLAAAGTLVDADKTNVTQSSVAKSIALSTLKAYIANALVFPAGSASANSWPKQTPGTLLTTPEVGALEIDTTNIYGTTDAGNRGYIPIRHFIRADATRTFTSDTNEQAIFTTPTNGRLTLETGTYLFEGHIYATVMSATSGNASLDVVGAGTAVCNDWLWRAYGIDANDPKVAATQTGSGSTTQQGAASIVTPAVNTAMAFYVSGTFTVTTGGTIIPSLTQVTASAMVIAIGSYMLFERMGGTSVTSVGQWD